MGRKKPATPRAVMYVYPEFKKKLKKQAIDTGISTIDYTKRIAENMELLTELEREFKEKRKKFSDFGRIL